MNQPRVGPGPRDARAPLAGARVVVCVSGGIAAYKTAELVRALGKAGANVSVAMTPQAQQFIGAMTFAALTGNPVFTDLWDLGQEAAIGHIKLADQADLVIVAPATASTIARLAAGLAADPVTAVCLATRAPVLVAPSMNVNMWDHPLTQANLARLRDVAGYRVIGPDDGYLACRWMGQGRMTEPGEIAEAAADLLAPKDLAGVRVVVTAGPTFEPIDAARYLGNRSSGKMGIALAAAARRRGAEVTLVLGPCAITPPAGVTTVPVTTALEMQRALAVASKRADVVVMAAAVADFRPAKATTGKLKRADLGATTSLALAQNPDLLAGLGHARGRKQAPILVGFAAETDDLVANAQRKLATKRCDYIVANDIGRSDAGFAVDTNEVTIVSAGSVQPLPAGTKADVAHAIWDVVAPRLAKLARVARFPVRP